MKTIKVFKMETNQSFLKNLYCYHCYRSNDDYRGLSLLTSKRSNKMCPYGVIYVRKILSVLTRTRKRERNNKGIGKMAKNVYRFYRKLAFLSIPLLLIKRFPLNFCFSVSKPLLCIRAAAQVRTPEVNSGPGFAKLPAPTLLSIRSNFTK